MTLEWISKELGARGWTGFIPLRIAVLFFENDREPFEFQKGEECLEQLSDCLIINIEFAT
jgi:hypothetical protein